MIIAGLVIAGFLYSTICGAAYSFMLSKKNKWYGEDEMWVAWLAAIFWPMIIVGYITFYTYYLISRPAHWVIQFTSEASREKRAEKKYKGQTDTKKAQGPYR